MAKLPDDSSDHHLVDIPEDFGGKLYNNGPVPSPHCGELCNNGDSLIAHGPEKHHLALSHGNLTQHKITLSKCSLNHIDTTEPVRQQEPVRIISKGDLEAICMPDDGETGHASMFRWRLHRQVLVQKDLKVNLSMRIIVTKDIQEASDPGYLELYFMELHLPMSQENNNGNTK
ncbi:hypothetical protein BGX27_004010 [Mortierella sp. AM989]|nr:hypothetical protein BGX27_004010 [Mortierella sp. AM989]